MLHQKLLFVFCEGAHTCVLPAAFSLRKKNTFRNTNVLTAARCCARLPAPADTGSLAIYTPSCARHPGGCCTVLDTVTGRLYETADHAHGPTDLVQVCTGKSVGACQCCSKLATQLFPTGHWVTKASKCRIDSCPQQPDLRPELVQLTAEWLLACLYHLACTGSARITASRTLIASDRCMHPRQFELCWSNCCYFALTRRRQSQRLSTYM